MSIKSVRIGIVAATLIVGAVAASAMQGGGGLQATSPLADATGFFHFERIDGHDRAIDPSGRAMTLAGVGILGAYLARIYTEAKGRPRYIVRKTNIKK